MNGIRAGLAISLAVHRLGLWLMWAILVGVLVVAVVLAAVEGPTDSPVNSNGAMTALVAYTAVASATLVSRGLPFAIVSGISRRQFFAAGIIGAAALAACWSGIATVMAAVESATGGWGVDLSFFRLSGYGAIDEFVLLAIAIVAAFFAGWTFGVVHLRWGTLGVLVGLGLAIAIGVTMVTLTLSFAPAALPSWLSDMPLEGRIALGIACGAAVFAAVSYRMTGRAAV